MKKIITNLTRLHKSRISGAAQRDKSEILSRCSAPTAKKSKIFSLCPSIAVIYAAVNVICIIPSSTSALSYSDNVGVNFTFDQSLTVSLSSADIVINNLAPGSASDSNIINVNVLSNNLSGYTLTSTVGNNTHTNPSYDNTSLTHISNIPNTPSINTSDASSTTSTPIFTSLSTSDSISSLDDFDNNTWGYTYSSDNSSWSNYSGLPLYSATGATLKTSTTPSADTGDTIKFKIAAKASTTQPSGEYRNVINFTVIAEHHPVSFYDAFKEAATKDPTITTLNGYYKMQDMTADICNTIEAEESQMTLIDTRDHNVYTVAKLKDNRCWMTTNLDLPGGTPLYSETSNVPAGYPESGGAPYYTLPESSPEGFDNNAKAFVYNSGNHTDNCASDQPCYSYYSWLTATAMSGVDIDEEDTDAPYSACPANWRLPTSRTTATQDSDFYRLATTYGMAQGDTFEYTSSFYTQAGPGTVPNFLLAGDYYNTTFYVGGSHGFYWSSTGDADKGWARHIVFRSDLINTNLRSYRRCGVPVRCLAGN